MNSSDKTRLAAWLLPAALMIPGASCNKTSSASSKPPTAPSAAASAAAGPNGEAAAGEGEACRNWSELDVEGLAPIPESQWSQTLEHVWRTLLEKHYDPTLACLDWPALRQQYAAELAKAETDAQAYETMNGLLRELGQSHLAIIPPRKQVSGEPRTGESGGSASVPIRARVIEGKLVVTNAAVDGMRSGIPAGAQIVAIEGHEIAPLLEQQRELWKREVESSFHVQRAAGAWLSCDPGARRTIRFIPFDKNEEVTKKVRCRERKVEKVSLGNLEDVPIEVEHRMLQGTEIGYLSFNVWMVPLVPKIEKGLAELRADGMKALVIDLRQNPGGVGMMAVPVARQFLSESASLGVMHMREADQHFKVTAAEDPFAGPIAILVDEGTGSTSEIFAQAMRDLGRVQVVGATPSQGAALPSLIEELPGGAVLQYVVADYKSPNGTAVEGKGVEPDVPVEETQADFARGKDPVLAAAIAALAAEKTQ